MLDIAKVIRMHGESGDSDTVFFFDKDREVSTKLKANTGEIGFPGEFG